jgi:DNA-directed RNA polymerase II subunit RPB11
MGGITASEAMAFDCASRPPRRSSCQHKAELGPDRHELYLLEDGEKKIESKDETRKTPSDTPSEAPSKKATSILRKYKFEADKTTLIGQPNSAIFTFNKEDHTLGNMLSQRLHKYPYVHFSAYRVPHPLFATFELRITTDGSITPKDALVKCCQDIVKDLDQLARSFTTEWLTQRIASETDRERLARERDQF